MTTVLVTGANGFVGSHLCRLILERGYNVRHAVRSRVSAGIADDMDVVEVGDIEANTNWCEALDGVDAVVHLAARVHVLAESATDPLAEFRKVNTAGTETLARQAALAGVRRFIYVSSVKATVATTDTPSLESDPPSPSDPYGQSKQEAEALLLGGDSALEPVVIRPPLIYGPGVGANFLRLLKIVKAGVPLPFSGIRNARSLVAVDNLCDLIATSLRHPDAAGEIFNVSDGEDVSIAELLTAIGVAMHRSPRLFYLPPGILRFGLAAIGRSDDFERLCGSLQLNTEKARNVLGWKPPVSMNEALQSTVNWYYGAIK